MEIICREDCGNAPLKELIRDYNIAFAKGDVNSIADKLTDDMVWEMVGDSNLTGKENVTKALEEMKDHTASTIVIDNIITHGKTASCNGKSVMAQNGKEFSFCDAYEYDKSGENARIKKMAS
ncbi:nuclear transport factor 2 family protein [Marinilabilia sp.]|uniref:nuclear transport factor 2 family protein n=1 Tax=Marinilabilia sp. TaxID=2021252 RepID=UPI0025B7AC98|nr:nuclear transport factor 2 family protein [Marinilabilia sp.]